MFTQGWLPLGETGPRAIEGRMAWWKSACQLGAVRSATNPGRASTKPRRRIPASLVHGGRCAFNTSTVALRGGLSVWRPRRAVEHDPFLLIGGDWTLHQ